MSEQSKRLPEETDGYAIFIEMIRQMMNPTEDSKRITDVCPYCDGIPTRIAKLEFFGNMADDIDGYVWACECGAYAQIAADARIVGLIADSTLHSSRKKVRHIILSFQGLLA